MISPSQIATARYAAEQRMQDSVVIGVETKGPLNEDTGLYEPTIVSPVYSGKCEYVDGNQGRDLDSQSQDLIEKTATIKIPVDATGSTLVLEDHVAIVTLAAHDSATIRVRVAAPHRQTVAKARRIPVKEVL